ncbi:winged helix-turn-helix domain-containing protein [Streptomyces griseoviridis]|jgi:DNA-binding transcriptional ArsR family regulator|uniref:DNA-binding transcriptional ArsR family regulator n=3 Tax=Streptomyces TaxID=1883 RepID=A0ABT9LB12_STRGD|nr:MULTISPECIES: winged helix-turn-helix domain-containing protein [Streptomyces]MDP9680903.1 DNA-binding transcriptional ArsR family regulator [Streptomyces griseoviridis]GGS34187.1 transcriptional regulator [Streptomyces niveoruber]GGT17197.1 transcriptional regulator [Streptomyces griseoviridis]GGU59753.1 transcriptional regulator [Streptomyces daghestanicus]GHI28557.1 transcriptional regulator [Streptomyces daghestanicus]
MTTKDPGAAGLARLAGLFADETRAACLLALLDGRAWTAGELARHAGVAASTASEHLGKLVAGGLLAEERQGRHRYVRLADDRVAQLVEDLAAQVAPGAARRPRTLAAAGAGSAMARARTCYDHLAGRLGIAVTDALTGLGLLRQDTGFALTDPGLAWFDAHGIPLARTGRRPLARGCLDWTERRPHLAGVAGAALCRHALDAGWCVRIGSERAVKVTAAGDRALSELFGIDAAALR